MSKNILNTFITKIISLCFSFLLLILTTRYLGAYGRGVISLIITGAEILVLLSGFIGGSSLIYLIPKYKSKKFFKQFSTLSFLWIIAVSFLGSFIFFFTGSMPKHLVMHIFCLGILSSLLTTIGLILLANEKIFAYNICSPIQVIINFLIFGLVIILTKSATVNIFVLSLYFSYIASISFGVYSLYKIWIELKAQNHAVNLSSTGREIIKYGFVSQLSIIIQYFNYRLSFLMLNYYHGPADVGIYSVGIAFSEMIWLFARSVSLIQYSKIANTGNSEHVKRLTVKLSKFSFSITALCVVLFLFIPKNIITSIFGRDFSGIKNIFSILSVGIVSLGFSMVLSHYFAGIGKYHITMLASFLGLLITITGNFLLVPKFSYIGAGLVASASYLTTSLFLVFAFIKTAKLDFRNFKINRDDFSAINWQA